MIGAPRKPVGLATPLRNVNVFIERRAGVPQEKFDEVVSSINASDMEELVPGILSAKIDGSHIEALSRVAEVSVMDEKAPKA